MNIKRISLISILLLNVSFAEDKILKDKLFNFKEEKNYFVKKRINYFQETINSLKNKTEEEKLLGINNLINEIPYGKDEKIYGKKDYWATPEEMITKDRGDCEDYVITKYYSLIHLGIDESKLFLTYVTSTKFKEAHMVLSYYENPNSIPLILDNYNKKILEANKREDLKPIYHLSLKEIEENKENKYLYIYEKYADFKTRIKKYFI